MDSSSQLSQSLAGYFNEIRPQIPTFLTVAVAAIIPIYAGSHASLSRPSTAAKPKKKDGSKKKSRSAEKRMEGLTPIDALLYPLGTGAMLTGLYYLIKWLQDPEILNKILNYYLTAFGLIAIWQFVRDLSLVAISFVFPARYSHRSEVWTVENAKRRFVLDSRSGKTNPGFKDSPLPGHLAQLPLPSGLIRILWETRRVCTKPRAIVDIFLKEFGTSVIEIDPSSILATVVALGTVLYYNLVDRPWWLTNLFGFSFCYSALQLLSPTTFWTGTLILTSLFFYDIYFVFYTPMMIEVATKLDIPAKLLIPKPSDGSETPGNRALTLLGLGDIVLPGIMLGLALRFDLYMSYLKRQKHNDTDISVHADQTGDISSRTESMTKVEYITATGNWGERFWLDAKARKAEGGSFSKVYFSSGMAAYVIGLLVTEIVMTVTKHGQPALLYLVPSVLGSLWMTALLRGELNYMWNYTEDEEADTSKKKADSRDVKPTAGKADIIPSQSISTGEDSGSLAVSDTAGNETTRTTSQDPSETPPTQSQESITNDSTMDSTMDSRKLFYMSISLPEDSETKPDTEQSMDSK